MLINSTLLLFKLHHTNVPYPTPGNNLHSISSSTFFLYASESNTNYYACFFRVPVQLAGSQVSLTPLHSATASALFTSLLSLHNNTWGCLSEGIILFQFSP
jgi:hypothetical protein